MAPILPFLALHSLWITPLIISQTSHESPMPKNSTNTSTFNTTLLSSHNSSALIDPLLDPLNFTAWLIITLPIALLILILTALFIVFRKMSPDDLKSQTYHNCNQDQDISIM